MVNNPGGEVRVRTALLVGAGVLLIALLFVLVGPLDLLAKSDKPEFCKGCHVMESEYEAWIHAGAHRRMNCVDCHLSQENLAVHYAWKTIDGAKDAVVFYSGTVPEHIKISSRGEETLQANCVRCHATTVEMINKERRCWDCHRRLAHTRSGAIATM